MERALWASFGSSRLGPHAEKTPFSTAKSSGSQGMQLPHMTKSRVIVTPTHIIVLPTNT